MDISKIIKMKNEDLQKEIDLRNKKISTMKTEISLFKRLMKNENPGFVKMPEERFPDFEFTENEVDEMVNPDIQDISLSSF